MRPIKILGGQSSSENPWGRTQYDALETKIQRRLSDGFNLLASYRLSKLFEDTAFWGPEISGPVPEHKLGGADRPHKLSVSSVWDLPIGHGRAFFKSMPRIVDAVAGGWELTGQFTIQSGAPIVFSTDSFYDGTDFHLRRGNRTLDRWFDTSHFVKFPNSNPGPASRIFSALITGRPVRTIPGTPSMRISGITCGAIQRAGRMFERAVSMN